MVHPQGSEDNIMNTGVWFFPRVMTAVRFELQMNGACRTNFHILDGEEKEENNLRK